MVNGHVRHSLMALELYYFCSYTKLFVGVGSEIVTRIYMTSGAEGIYIQHHDVGPRTFPAPK